MENHFRKFSWNDNIESLSTSLVTSFQTNYKSSKLQSIIERQEATNQVTALSNRVEKLKKDKYLADKEIFEAKKRIKYVKKQINNRNKKANEKLTRTQERTDLEENTRKKCQSGQEERKKNIKEFEGRIVKSNKIAACYMKRQSKDLDELKYFNKVSDLKAKRENCKRIGCNYVDALRQRCLSQRSDRSKSKENYLKSIEYQHKVKQQAIKKLSKLEEEEESLIQELSKTLETRNFLIENLNKLKSA